MPSENVVDLASHREKWRAAQRPPKAPIPERLAIVLIGSILALVGFGLSLLLLGSILVEPQRFFLFLVGAAGVSFIGLFGLSWVIQGVRGRSRHEGVFYILLGKLGAWGPWPWSLLIPATALLALGVATLTGDTEAMESAIHWLGGWLIFVIHLGFHELGHYVAARLVSLEPSRVLVGPAELSRSPGGWKLTLSREWWSIFGGWVQVHKDGEELPPRTRLVFAAGGPVATAALLLATVTASPMPFVDMFYRSSATLTVQALAFGTQIGTLFLVMSLIPFAGFSESSPTDGDQILSALRQMRKAAR